MCGSGLGAAIYDGVLAWSEGGGLRAWRQALLAEAHGEVVEIGAGTGLNLDAWPRQPGRIARLTLTEPSPAMRARLAGRLERQQGEAGQPLPFPVRVLAAGAEALPLASGEADVVVGTLVLCTVPDPAAALAEVRRVLRPGGRLLFLEHVAAPRGSRRRGVQRALEPAWRPLAGGCHLTRETEAALQAAGLRLESVQHGELPRAPGFLRPSIRGVAVRDG